MKKFICIWLSLQFLLLTIPAFAVEVQQPAASVYQKGQQLISEKQYTKAFKTFIEAAERGNADAQYMLAAMTFNGFGTSIDVDKAIDWAFKAHEGLNRDAACLLGQIYQESKGDIQTARQWYEIALKQGDGNGAYGLGRLANCYDHDSKKADQYFAKAIELYKDAIDKGNPHAARFLAYLYQHVYNDYDQAIYYFERSFEMGDSKSAYELGRIYSGNVRPDSFKAHEWYEKSYQAGDAMGAYGMGFVCTAWKCHPENEHKWYVTSLEQSETEYKNGSLPAMFTIASCRKELGDLAGAVECLMLPYAAHHRKAAFLLGRLYRHSIQNFSQALKWFQIAFDEGDVSAAAEAGLVCEEELLDYSEAERWYNLAYESGDPKGASRLGSLYEHRLNDPETAAEWYKSAYEAGDKDMAYHLACLYQARLSNDQEAIKWYKITIKDNHNEMFVHFSENSLASLEK